MPDVTPNRALPFMTDDDPLADVAQAIEDLAMALDEGDAGWVTSSTTWNGSSGSATIGNGSVVCKINRGTHRVDVMIQVTFGSTTVGPSGNWQVSFPVAESAYRWTLDGIARDDAGNSYRIVAERTSSGTMTLRCDPVTAGNPLRSITNTVPFTWEDGDVLTLHGSYEPA